jgi:TatD DNase family protein
MKLFDSHAHYFDSRLDGLGGADKVLSEEVFGKEVERLVNVGTSYKSSLLAIGQAKKYDGMYAAVGVHPEDARELPDDPKEELTLIRSLLENKAENKIVAIGEIGFDYHYEGHDKAKQARYFEEQMKLARELSMPVIIHDREAHGDCFDMILKYPDVKGVFHSYSGSAEMAAELVKRGWYISFSGVLTFKNARKVVEVAEKVPLDRVLIETDTPYLAPHPYRGQINHSGLVRYTAEKLAEIKGMSAYEISDITFDNASRLFRI